ncbi:hypothetical protein WA158_008531 [Blastocystis sp. Blastoise]
MVIIDRVISNLPAHHTEVFEGDLTYSHLPSSTVSITLDYIISYLIPGVITLITTFVLNKKNPFYPCLNVIYVSLQSYALTELIVKSLKVIAGRPRPSFFAICGYPLQNNNTRIYGTYGVVADITKCQNTDSISEAFSSFPSGHSSVAMGASSLYILIYIYQLYPLIPNCSLLFKKAISLIWCFLLFFMALFVGASRFFDFKHFISDIFAGFIISICVSLFSYYMTYKMILDVDSEKKKYDDGKNYGSPASVV